MRIRGFRNIGKLLFFLAIVFSDLMSLKGQNPQTISPELQNALLLQHRGEKLFMEKKYSEALAVFKKSSPRIEKILGKKHVATGLSYYFLGNSYFLSGETKAGIDGLQKAAEIYEFNRHENTEDVFELLATIYQNSGDNGEAIPVLEKLLALRQRKTGKNSIETAKTFNLLGSSYQIVGNDSKAIECFLSAIQIYSKKLKPDDPVIAVLAQNLGSAYLEAGNAKEATLHLEKALEILNTLNLENTSDSLLVNYSALGRAYADLGEFDKGIVFQQRCLDILSKSSNLNNIEAGKALHNLAACYIGKNDFVNAFTTNDEAYKIFSRINGDNHPFSADSLSQKADIFMAVSNYESAVDLYSKVLEIRKRIFEKNHKSVANAYNNLSTALCRIKKFDIALNSAQSALQIAESIYGKNNSFYATILNNLSNIYQGLGDTRSSQQAAIEALQISSKLLPEDHPAIALYSFNISVELAKKGEFSKSEEYLDKSYNIYQENFEYWHPNILQILEGYTIINFAQGNNDKAKLFADKTKNSVNKQLEKILLLDEASRLSWQNQNYHKGYFPYIQSPAEISEILYYRKGIIFDSVASDRKLHLSKTKNSEKLNQLNDLRSKLSRMIFLPQNQASKTEINNLSNAIRNTEMELANSKSTSFLSSFPYESAIRAIPDGTAFINYFVFTETVPDSSKTTLLQNPYIGVLIHLSKCTPTFIKIPLLEFLIKNDGMELLSHVDELRQSIDSGDSEKLEHVLVKLSSVIWHPVQKALPSHIHQVIISPDWKLNFIPFGVLLNSDGSFLAQKYDISYMASLRDLVREINPSQNKNLRIFGNPVFDKSLDSIKDTKLALRSTEIDVFGQIQLPSLPGSEKECAEIQKIAASEGWDLQTFTREQADESNLRQTKKPGILHLATHGFYLNSYTPPIESTRGMSVVGVETSTTNKKGVDPMRASGIALTGAQSTLRSWAERKAPDPDSDGILTAEEVAALDLDGTWLVSLSACETGVGEARSGEGVLGLRRSFMMAGAENLLMTLWPVSDQTTPEIMADFYREALKTGNAPGSFAKVQREWLVKLRKEKGLLEAVCDAGPFVMATIGKPLPPLPREPAKEPSILDKVTQKIESLIKSSNTDIKNN
jgi:tetratricopeptide (TPR) repeat protein/CHAT domain-containing protein